ncbi:MAG: Ig-like domain repeat protein [Terracidiphilus sp.]
MAIESATFLRRLARIVTLVLIVALFGGVFAAAQPAVMVGSVVQNQNAANEYGQIYRIVVAKNGNVLFLDAQNGALYQLAPGATTLTTLSAPGSVLKGSNNFWNSGMALDNYDTLYITSEYNTPYFYRVPYTPGPNGTNGTWNLTGSSDWAAGDLIVGDSGSREAAFDDNNNMYVSTENSPSILTFSVDANGIAGPATTLVKNLKAEAAKMTVDHAGNVYFIEDCWSARNKVAVGVWMIPKGVGVSSTVVGEVSPLVRIDPPALGYNFKGVSVDAAGNLYFSSVVDSGGSTGGDGNASMVLMVPNESGSPTTATAATLNWSHAAMVAPVSATASIAVDPRGFLWIPTQTNGWVPPNSTEPNPPAYPGTNNWVQYALGSVNLGASPIGAPSAAGTVFFSFNAPSTTPAKIVFSQPGSGSDFAVVTTNPLENPGPPPTVDTTAIPCTAGTTYTSIPPLYTSCPYWLAVNPRVAGAVSGQLQMLDSSNDVIGQGAAYVYGVGQGPEISLLGSPVTLPIGSGFVTPQQIAVDSTGAAYVADSGHGKVLQYPAGSTAATTPISVGTGFTAPTGVAVDGLGNVYVADSGKVTEVPYVSGALDSDAQTVIQSGLGTALNLAVDGAGNVYVADELNAQVVKISNPSTKSTLFRGSTLSLDSGYALGGFTRPSAVAVDAWGNVFVADGTNLDEVTPLGAQTTITTGLSGNVTGLATDASGSVYVAEGTQLIRIPAEAGTLTFNDAVGIGLGTVNSPSGVALDRTGNLYVSYVGSGSAPAFAQLSVKGSFDLGVVPVATPTVESDAEVQLFNIGNLPLTLSALSGDVPTGANAADYLVVTAGDNPTCSGTTPINAGVYCYFGFGITPTLTSGTETASIAILSNASNAPSLALGLSASPFLENRPATITTISPITAPTYPGSVTITVKVTSTAGTPQGTVKLGVSGQGTHSATLNGSGVATFSFSGLQGGVYNVNAAYEGYGTSGTAPDFAVSSTKATFTVNPAAPVMTVSTPAAYVFFGGSYTITANVSSGIGVPTGTVAFMNGTSLADPTQPPITLTGLGIATFNTTNLARGTYTLKAVYSGDQNYAPTTVTIATFNIIPESVLITSTPPALTLTPGVPGSVSLNLQGLVGFGGLKDAVVIRCVQASLPQYSECTFDNTTVLISPAGASATVVMTISTNVPVNGGTAALRSGPAPWALGGIFGFGLIGLVFGKKARFNGRALTMICLLLLFAGTVFGITACTNNGYTHTPPRPIVTTPAGTSNVEVTTTWNGALVSLPFTLPVTVQ